MEENRKIRVGITQGDTNGVGYELIFKTFAEPDMLELCTPVIYGSPKVAAYHRKALGLSCHMMVISSAEEIKDGKINLLTVDNEEIPVSFGQATPEAGEAALRALDKAMSDFRAGVFDVLVTAPMNKSTISAQGIDFKGHVDYIATCLGEGQKTLPLLVSERLRMAFATQDVALKDVPHAIDKDTLAQQLIQLGQTLCRDFSISAPRIAVLSLNPAVDDEGHFGIEEQEYIVPAIAEAETKKIQAFGPYAADSFFGEHLYEQFDAVLAMYHDQGMTPFKAMRHEYGVIEMAGLPVVAVSPLQGADYDEAGKGVADESDFRNALYLALDVYRNRKMYDEPLGHPLKKLYKERRDESEKVRFSVPKKHGGVTTGTHRAEAPNDHTAGKE